METLVIRPVVAGSSVVQAVKRRNKATERLRTIGGDKNKPVLSKKRKSVGMERVKKESHESGKEEKSELNLIVCYYF